MVSYTHLDLDDRRRLYQLINTGRSPRQAAVELGRHASTIYRELKRNRHLDEEPIFRGYFPVTAQGKAAARRLRGERSSDDMNWPLTWWIDCGPPGHQSRSLITCVGIGATGSA